MMNSHLIPPEKKAPRLLHIGITTPQGTGALAHLANPALPPLRRSIAHDEIHAPWVVLPKRSSLTPEQKSMINDSIARH